MVEDFISFIEAAINLRRSSVCIYTLLHIFYNGNVIWLEDRQEKLHLKEIASMALNYIFCNCWTESVPPVSVFREGSRRKKALNTSSLCSGLIPGPLSSIVIIACSELYSNSTLIISAYFLELIIKLVMARLIAWGRRSRI